MHTTGYDPKGEAGTQTASGVRCMLYLWFLVPLVFGAVQLLLMSLYSLHGSHLAVVRRLRLQCGEGGRSTRKV